MAARLDLGRSSPRARLLRLSVVFAVELRLKIVAELYRRVMSPQQFQREFGGGSISRVHQNFERLAKTGWLKYIRSEGPGGKRRGAVEHFYRATHLALFDAESWALVPYPMRVASSLSLFNQIAWRLRQVLESSDVDRGHTRDLSCTQVSLDQVGWEHMIEAVDARFSGLFEEQDDARIRVSEDELIQADVLMLAFESPTQGGRSSFCLVESDQDLMAHFPERLAPFLGDEVCEEILSESSWRQISATQFHRERGEISHSGVSRRFKRLTSAGWLRRVSLESGGRRRGATEQFFRATKPAINSKVLTDPPETLKGTQSWRTFERFVKDVQDAMRAGTLDGRTDRYVTLSFLSLDQQGWENVVAGLEELSVFILREQARAKERMAKSGEKPIRLTLALGAFESPGDTQAL